MKQLSRFAACLALFAAASVCGYAAGFVKTADYTPGRFNDVSSGAWYASEVQTAYELGLMNGTSADTFDPEGNVTVAQTLTVASRISSIYCDKAIGEVNGEWYAPYLAYAKENGFLAVDVSDPDRPATRAEVASVFAKALPQSYYTPQNDVAGIPDVSEKQPYHDALLMLYRAGIVMGSDAFGDYRPFDDITRAEISTIICRAALPEKRLKKTLDKVSADDAYALLLTPTFNSAKEGIASGWQLDNRGNYTRNSIDGGYNVLLDVSDSEGTAVVREFNPVSSGFITFNLKFVLSGEPDGAFFEFLDVSGRPLYRMESKDGFWTLSNADADSTPMRTVAAETGIYTVTVTLDLDNARANTYFDDAFIAAYPLSFTDGACILKTLRIGTTGASRAALSLSYANAYVNYALIEDFTYARAGVLPRAFTGESAAVSSGQNMAIEENGFVNAAFSPVSGCVVGEMSYYTDEASPLEYRLMSGEKTIVSLTAADGVLYANGQKTYDLCEKMWYRLRVECDTDMMSVRVKLNDRVIASVPFAEKATSADRILVRHPGTGILTTDNYKVYRLADHDDYVPVPQKIEDDYNIGVNVCSLWRNGFSSHTGWACISPYDEPVLGYYDEGVPETADWEIKYLVEHGVDFQAFCWFADKPNAPLCAGQTNTHLHDGFMNARYADLMKYTIIFEAVGGQRPRGLEAWKTYYVPFLIENYFKDSRYLVIDNKPVFCVFGARSLAGADSLGHMNAVKEALDYLDEAARAIGFDGVLKVNCGETSADFMTMGFDVTYAYGWGYDGWQYEANVSNMLKSASIMPTLPTISVGFNNVAWAHTRRPMMSVGDFERTCVWVRDEFLPEQNAKGLGVDNLVMLSNWNEYGEGTYLMPCRNNGGFGYLDTLRRVFGKTETDASLDVLPTKEQKARITHLYPQELHLLRPLGFYQKAGYDEYTVEKRFEYARDKTVPGGLESQMITDDGLLCVSKTGDPNVPLSFPPYQPDLSRIKAVRIRAAIPAGEKMQLFFTTVEENVGTEDKSLSLTSETDEMTDYIFDFSANPKWKGKMASYIRFDPTGRAGVTFTLQSLELLVPPQSAPMEMNIAGETFAISVPYEYTANGETLIPFDPSTAMDFRLGLFHRWDASSKALTLSGHGHTAVFAVGKDTYTLDGAQKPLGFVLSESDGLPMLPVSALCDAFDFSASLTFEGAVRIDVPDAVVKQKPGDRVPGSWEFNTVGDSEGWSSANLTVAVSDGSMTVANSTAGNDPSLIMTGLDLEAERFIALEYRVRYRYTPVTAGQPSAIHLYYSTDTDSGMNEEKAIYCKLASTDSSGEWETYTADLTALPKWTGKIRMLRLDPFNANGIMEFDYVRLIEDPDYVDPMNRPFELKGANPSLGDSIPFVSPNGTVSIEKDPDDPENACYLVMSRGGNAYVYLRQNTFFKPGKTYTVDFDVRIAALDDKTDLAPDFSGAISCNMIYRDGGKSDHVIGFVRTTVGDGWTHASFTHAVSEEFADHGADCFAIYSNPVDNLGVGYYIDNIVVKESDDFTIE